MNSETREEQALRWLRVGQRWWDLEYREFVTILGLDPGTMYPVRYQWYGERSEARNTAVGFLTEFQPSNLLEFLESTLAASPSDAGAVDSERQLRDELRVLLRTWQHQERPAEPLITDILAAVARHRHPSPETGTVALTGPTPGAATDAAQTQP